MKNLGKYKRFMPIVQAVAGMSKSPTTKVGAIVLGPGFEIRSTGWNGAPRGSDADVDGRTATRESRLIWASHAEANAVSNAARCGVSLDCCVMVVTHTPCMACAKLIVQSGIRGVICPEPTGDFAERWRHEFNRGRELFAECGVELIEFSTEE